VTSPNRPQQDPRLGLRDLIAENEGKRRNGAASDGRGWYRTDAERMDCYAVADAVMELFAAVVTREVTLPLRDKPTHVEFEIVTKPEVLRGED
jgi:hypothetical protein